MQIGTAVFKRIVNEHRNAAIDAVQESMVESVRFGLFNKDYVRGCAEGRFQEHLDKKQNG